MIYVGVDPGSKSGAYAFIDDRSVRCYPWDNQRFVEDVRIHAYSHERCIAVVEKVGAMPKQGISSTWVFAENFGYIQGVLHALGIPYQLVPPRVWKKEFSLNSNKAKSIEVCHRLFPDVSIRRTEKCRTDDSNFAEAILLAEFARRKLGGERIASPSCEF